VRVGDDDPIKQPLLAPVPEPTEATDTRLVFVNPPWAAAGASFWRRYRWFLGATASVHAVSAIASMSLTKAKHLDFPTRLCTSYSSWQPKYNSPVSQVSFSPALRSGKSLTKKLGPLCGFL